MNNWKKVGDRTDPCGTPVFTDSGAQQCPSTTVDIGWAEKKLEMKVQREE